MSLKWYRRPRLVVLSPHSPVRDAARAIEQNRIGAVVIQARGKVVGIVTDRDLAVRALGRGLDPATTAVAEVMTPDPVTLSPTDGIADAIDAMREHNVRRIPLAAGGRVLGMVTLDDLLLDEAAPLDEVAAIVASQIADGGPLSAQRPAARRRGHARAEATLARMVDAVGDEAGLDAPEQARRALDTVLAALVRRLLPQEAGDLIAQLPSLLQPALRALPPGPDKVISEGSILAALQAELGVDPVTAARVLGAAAGVIAGSISEGQAEDVRGQLPKGLREIFREHERVPLFI